MHLQFQFDLFCDWKMFGPLQHDFIWNNEINMKLDIIEFYNEPPIRSVSLLKFVSLSISIEAKRTSLGQTYPTLGRT